MPTFHFKAKNIAGGTVSGSIEAASEQEVLTRLSGGGHVPLNVRRLTGSRKWWDGDLSLALSRVKKKDLMIFTRQLRSLLVAGVPVVSAIDAIVPQTKNPRLKATVRSLGKEVEEGSTLSDAMSSHVRVFGELYVHTIKGGEISGMLDGVLQRLSETLEHEVEMEFAIKSAVRYPIMVIGAMACSIAFVMTFVVPRFSALYSRFHTRLPLPTRALITISNLVRDYWFVFVIGGAFLLIAFARLVRKGEGRRIWHRVLCTVPVMGTLLKEIAVSRFSRLLSMLIRSGLPMTRALDAAGEAVGNALVEREVGALSESVEEGAGLSPVLVQSTVFPPMVGQMVAMGEKSGTVDTALEEVSRYYDAEVKYKVKNLTTLLEPVLLVVLAAAVLGLMLAIFLPLWDMIKLFRH
jgi:MSHA biogenesis protein MshG